MRHGGTPQPSTGRHAAPARSATATPVAGGRHSAGPSGSGASERRLRPVPDIVDSKPRHAEAPGRVPLQGPAPRPLPPTGATQATVAAPVGDGTTATPGPAPVRARRPAARRSDPEEIAARATTTLISASPDLGRAARPAEAAAPAALAAPAPVAGAAPVFADRTGRRARRWRTAAIAATAICASYVGVVAVGAVAGPVGPTSSPTLLPAPTTAPPAPTAIPGPAAQNVAEVEPTATSTTTRSARATTRSTPRTTTPKARVAPRPVVVAPVPVVPQAPARANPAPVADTQNVPNAQNDAADAADDAGADT